MFFGINISWFSLIQFQYFMFMSFFWFLFFYFFYSDFPSITLLNTSYSVMVGSSVTIACDYSSSPAPNSITWQRIQNAQSTIINVLDSRYGGGTVITPYLTIHATLLSDAGVYTCSVTNQVGTSTSNPIFLFVNGSEYGPSCCAFKADFGIQIWIWLILMCFFFKKSKTIYSSFHSFIGLKL